MREMRNVYKILVGETERKRLHEEPRRGWEDNSKMDLKQTACEDVDWINLAKDSVQWWVP
jgi:hypothetical protein